MDYYLGTSKKQRPESRPKILDYRRRVYYDYFLNSIVVILPYTESSLTQEFIGFL